MTSYGIRYLFRRSFWQGVDAGIGGVSRKAIAHAAMQHVLRRLCSLVTRRPTCVFDYEDALPFLRGKAGGNPTIYPSIVPRWDHSPRSGGRRTILHGSTPNLFRRHVREVLHDARVLPAEERIVFVKSWNEWAEGNYLEPDHRYGRQYLDVLREEVMARPRHDRATVNSTSVLAPSASS
jgi:hypothetical protein